MTVQHLRYFLAVAQYLHFGEAAKACYVSQPSLSHSIAELETELGLKLFYRDNRSVALTAAGKVFYEDVQDIVDRLDGAELRARRAASGMVGSLNIGTLGGLASGEFPSQIAAFRRRYPDVDVNLSHSNIKSLNTNLLTGAIDVALTRRIGISQRSDEIVSRTLYCDRFGVVVRHDHPFALAGSFSLEELEREDFVFLSQTVTPGVYNYTIRLCTSRGFVPNILRTAATLEGVCSLIKSGMGIGILPECALAYSSGLLVFLPLDGEDAVSEVVLAWRRRNTNPVVPNFLEELGIEGDLE